jgi:hypothetical protein
MSANSFQQGPGQPVSFNKKNKINALCGCQALETVLGAGSFLPGGKNFPLKKAGFIGIDQSVTRLPRLGSDYK